MKKKHRNRGGSPTVGFRPELQALQASSRELTQILEASQASPTPPAKQPGASQEKAKPCLPRALGEHLLARMTRLETNCDLLARRAKAAGDLKTGLTAIRLSFTILSTMVKLAEKYPHLAETWQPSESEEPWPVPPALPPEREPLGVAPGAPPLGQEATLADPSALPQAGAVELVQASPEIPETLRMGGEGRPPEGRSEIRAAVLELDQPAATPALSPPRDTRLRPVNADW